MDRAALSRQCEQAEQRSVLVVDDDLRNIRLVGSLLTESGFRVHVADNGLLALAIAREVQPDLVLLDILLPPRMNGIETCHRLKVCPDTRAIPVIFLTGKEDEETMVRAFEVGGADYVQKPFNAQVLLARVRTHTELGLLSRELERTLAERTRELSEANATLRKLAMEVSLIEEREKKRLAANLHDSPMQNWPWRACRSPPPAPLATVKPRNSWNPDWPCLTTPCMNCAFCNSISAPRCSTKMVCRPP